MKFLSYVEKLEKEVRLQAIIILALLLIVFLEGILLYRASTHKVVVVVPPRLDREFWVAGDTLSRTYLEQVALFIADRLLNVSPENVDRSISAVYPFLTTDPQAIKTIKELFVNYISTIEKEDWTQSFHPLKVEIGEENITVEGILHKISGSTYIGQERRILNLSYKVQNGRLIITEVKF